MIDLSTSRKPLDKPAAPPRKARKEPLFLPESSSSTGNLYIDDEAIESDNEEGAEHYTEEDLAFIDDTDEVSAELDRPKHPRSSHKPVPKASSHSSQSSDEVSEGHAPQASVGKRSEISSDDFDGIESVEEELNEVKHTNSDPSSPKEESGSRHQNRFDQLDTSHDDPGRADSLEHQCDDDEIYGGSHIEMDAQPTDDTVKRNNIDVIQPDGNLNTVVDDYEPSEANFSDYMRHYASTMHAQGLAVGDPVDTTRCE